MNQNNQIPVRTLIDSFVTLITEAYAGPPDPKSTWFIDNEPDSGILGVIEGLSAEQASRSVDGSGEKGSTIAANVEHLRWTLANANQTFRGAPWDPDWATSWKTVGLTESEWSDLKRAVRDEFQRLLEVVGQQQELQGEYLNGLLAMVPHAAFHLGLIRQMVERVR